MPCSKRCHPDLAVRVTNGLIAVEVELQRKAARRQRGICAMYKGLTDAHGSLLGVMYVTDRNDVSQLVERTAAQVGLGEPEVGFPRDAHARRPDLRSSRGARRDPSAAAMISLEEIMDPDDVAELLHLKRSTVIDYARRGVLPGKKLGKHWLFLRSELDDTTDSDGPTQVPDDCGKQQHIRCRTTSVVLP